MRARTSLHVVATSLLALVAASGCRTTDSEKGGKSGAGASGPSVWFTVPANGDYDVDEAKAIKAYKFFFYSVDERCDGFDRQEVASYRKGEKITLEIDPSCSYKLGFTMGGRIRAANGDVTVAPYYESATGLLVDATSQKLRLQRTTAGAAAGYVEPWVELNVKASGFKKVGEDGSGSGSGSASGGTSGPTGATGVTGASGTTGVTGVTGSTGGGAGIVSYDDVKSILTSRCTPCHSPTGSRPSSDLTTYEKAKAMGSSVVQRVDNNSMPPSGPLSGSEKDKIAAWGKGGFAAAGGTAGSSGVTGAIGASGTGGSDLAGNGIVAFRIPRGTGNGAWNTAATTATAKVGQTLRIYNDDDVVHQMHTNGAPCQHGDPIEPGAYGDCVMTSPFEEGPLYDHISQGDFYVRGTR